MNDEPLRAIARCGLCSQVLLDVVLDPEEESEEEDEECDEDRDPPRIRVFEKRAWKIRHSCKYPPANYKQSRRFTYEVVPEGF